MRTIAITPVPGTGLAENKDDARRLRETVILPLLERGEQVELDFGRVEVATQSFVHALISEAVRRYSESSFDRIKFANCSEEVRETVLTVFEYTFAAADAAEEYAKGTPEMGFAASTVSKLVGLTYRQLDYFSRTELVTPSVRAAGELGGEPLYSFTDVVELRIIKRLQDAGVSLSRSREAIRFLREQSAGRPLTDMALVSDGRQIFAARSGEELDEVLSRGQAFFGISPGRVWADTAADLAHLPTQERREGIHITEDDDEELS
jgi:DNA-binding transcriptional MerR regulator